MYYLEDLYEGQEFISPGRTITEADVGQFVGLSGDYNPLHTDEEFAKGTKFGTRVVPGLLGLSVLAGLMHRLGVFDGTALAALGLENWRFRAPIYIGDTVHFTMTIAGVRRTAAGGVVQRHFRLLNQRGQVVQEGDFAMLVAARSSGDAG